MWRSPASERSHLQRGRRLRCTRDSRQGPRELREAVTALPEELRAPHVVIEATLWPNYLASSHYPDELLKSFGLYHVGTRQARADRKSAKMYTHDAATKTLLLAGPDEGINDFLNLALTPPESEDELRWNQLREFADLGLSSPERIVRLPTDFGQGELFTWEAVLSTVGRSDEERVAWANLAFEKWTALVNQLHGEVDVRYRRLVGSLTFVPVSLSIEGARAAGAFNLLRVMRPMPRIRSVPTEFFRSVTIAPPVPRRPVWHPNPPCVSLLSMGA